MRVYSEFGYYQITLRASEDDDYPALTDLAYFLHDFNLLYEFSRVILDPKYGDYEFSRFFAYRNRYRIDDGDRLAIERLSKQSPLTILAVVAALPGAAATFWILVQAFEKIANFGLNREILKLNRDKLREELKQPHPQGKDLLGMTHADFRERVHIREAEYTYDRIERHLEENPIRVREIEVTYTRELPPKREGDT